MAKQTINLGTSPNKGDGDPLRTAFDKVNDNFTELYVDLKQVKSAQTGGGTLIVDTIGSVHGTDSTLLVDGNNSKIVGPIASPSWIVQDQNVDITTTNTGVNANITLSAQGVVTIQESTAEDYVQVSSNGVVLYSNSDIRNMVDQSAELYDAGCEPQCSMYCQDRWLDSKKCGRECNSKACNFNNGACL